MKILAILLLLSGCAANVVTEPAPKPELCARAWDACVIGDGQPGAPTIKCDSDGAHSYCTCTGREFGKPIVAKCVIDDQPPEETP